MTGRSKLPNPALIALREGVGEKIRQWVHDTKLTHAQAARLSGLSETDITFINQGDISNIRLDRLLEAWIAIGGKAELVLTKDQ